MSDFQSLPKVAFIFLLTAIFFVVGLVILSSIQANDNVSPLSTVTSENVTAPALQGNVTLLKTYVQSVTSITNSTGATVATNNYTLFNTNTGTAGKVQFLSNTSFCITGNYCYITYTYNNHNSDAGVATSNALLALAEIPNNWLLLIATVLAASIVIGVVMNNLGRFGGRE